MDDPRADLPAVSTVLEDLGDRARLDGDALTALVRAVLADLRDELGRSVPADDARSGRPDRSALAAQVVAEVLARQADLLAPPGPVVNATGVLLHTGLGRAPLSPSARRAVADAAGAHAVELDDSGRRGHRDHLLATLVGLLTGAEDATFANNGAGALVLALRAAAGPGRVVVSRGELIEIGGSFRLPELIEAAGVELVEVGTTNRTHLHDVTAALDTGVEAVLVVHPSNYRVEGFATRPALADVVTVAHAAGAAVVHDVGSGLLRAATAPALADEPVVRDSLDAGVDLVTASGDKLLGGPQAGLVAGRRTLVGRARRDPLARALRLDKLRVAALQATLQDQLAGGATTLRQLLDTPADDLRRRAEDIRARLRERGAPVDVIATDAVVGGGSVPGSSLPSFAIVLPERLAARLRHGSPPVLARVHDGHCLLDLRAVPPDDDHLLVDAVARSWPDGPPGRTNGDPPGDG